MTPINASAWRWGVCGSASIAVIFYFVQVLGMQSWTAPASFFARQWYFVLPLAVGFGVQLGLFRAIRLLAARHGGATVATSGGVSTGAMLACCMHNLTLLVPILGMSGLAAFFAAYQSEVFIASIVVVTFGVIVLAKQYRKTAHSGVHSL